MKKEQAGFRCRSALCSVVTASGQKYVDRTGDTVRVFGVQGGYESRSLDRGEPSGSVVLIATLSPKKKRTPLFGKPIAPVSKGNGKLADAVSTTPLPPKKVEGTVITGAIGAGGTDEAPFAAVADIIGG